MRFALIFGILTFAVGALIAERYGLPGPVTGLTDKGFDKIETTMASLLGPDETVPTQLAVRDDSQAEIVTASDLEAEAAPLPRRPAADNADLSINEDGLEIIKASRGLTLSPTPENGVLTIGYGHTASVEPDMTITVPEADQLLMADLETTQNGIRNTVSIPLNENEYSALVSFAASIGIDAFPETDVYALLEAGDREGAAKALQQHTVARTDNGEMVQMPSLMERRERERQLFLSN